MGLFSRKSAKHSTDGDSIASNATRTNSTALKSPHASKFVDGGSFPSSSVPDVTLPAPPDPKLDPAAYLRSINSVRERSRLVYQRAKRNQLYHFDVDASKFGDTAHYVVSIIKRDYGPDYHNIPAHGRWQHFEAGGRPRVGQLLATWPSTIDKQEQTRRLLDLFLVSVLLDAGAGTRWSYKSKESGKLYKRSEGLAVASLEMFKAGYFSSDSSNPCQVDSAGLARLDLSQLTRGLQVSETNPIAGLEGRAGLLDRLADALSNSTYFGRLGRPGHMLDYLLSHPSTEASSVPIITVPTLWSVLVNGLSSVWPSTRTSIDGVSLGDAWPCSSMPSSPPALPWEAIVPFHKLTQWLCYSLMTPMTKILKVHFAGIELLTGLPEYRNGGLLVDTGLLTLKEKDYQRGVQAYKANAMIKGQPNMEVVPLFPTEDDVIVEWRAVTVGFLDDLLVEVNGILGLSGPDKLSLAQMLEAGTWKGGRELAEVSRPNTKEPPIMIVSDGTVTVVKVLKNMLSHPTHPFHVVSLPTMEGSKAKPAKKKILLMGKSGSGKSSMRSIIFSNYVAKDVRRLGATIDVEHAQFKFLGNLILNLWDCGGQDAFTETYLTTQKRPMFSDVGVLIYVFDTESRHFNNASSTVDLDTYAQIINALHLYSPQAHVFCLVHKMDLVPNERREDFLHEKSVLIAQNSGGFSQTVRTYPTSIWDETLYAAWGEIVQCLTPNLSVMESYLRKLAKATRAEEIVLFERATFLKVINVTTPLGDENPYADRFERLSNLIKTFKHSLQTYTNQGASHPFGEFTIMCPRFNLVLARLTGNTYVLVVLPPGQCDLVNTRLNLMGVRDGLMELEQPE
ncbi:MAG: hypothetical protein Q9163_004639 [Psora crenata]